MKTRHVILLGICINGDSLLAGYNANVPVSTPVKSELHGQLLLVQAQEKPKDDTTAESKQTGSTEKADAKEKKTVNKQEEPTIQPQSTADKERAAVKRARAEAQEAAKAAAEARAAAENAKEAAKIASEQARHAAQRAKSLEKQSAGATEARGDASRKRKEDTSNDPHGPGGVPKANPDKP